MQVVDVLRAAFDLPHEACTSGQGLLARAPCVGLVVGRRPRFRASLPGCWRAQLASSGSVEDVFALCFGSVEGDVLRIKGSGLVF